MALYEVVGICAYAQDGQVVRHRRPGAVVELDEYTAAQLGAAVKPKRRTKPPPSPDPISIPIDVEADGGEN